MNFEYKGKQTKKKTTEKLPPLLFTKPHICASAMPRAKKGRSTMNEDESTLLIYLIISLWQQVQ